MEYPFQKLDKFLEEEGLELTKSITLPKKSLGEVVIVGGKITFICEDFAKNSTGNYVVEVDDGLGLIQIYLISQVYEAFKDKIKIGNLIGIKGRVAERNNNIYVAGTSIELVEEYLEEGVF